MSRSSRTPVDSISAVVTFQGMTTRSRTSRMPARSQAKRCGLRIAAVVWASAAAVVDLDLGQWSVERLGQERGLQGRLGTRSRDYVRSGRRSRPATGFGPPWR